MDSWSALFVFQVGQNTIFVGYVVNLVALCLSHLPFHNWDQPIEVETAVMTLTISSIVGVVILGPVCAAVMTIFVNLLRETDETQTQTLAP